MTSDDVRRMENSVLAFSCAVCALAEIQGMAAENQLRAIQEASPAYGEEAFAEVIKCNAIGWNGALGILRRGT